VAVWATLDDVRRLWPDARVVDDTTLGDLIAASSLICARFALPSIADDPTPPDVVPVEVAAVRRLAVALESRELWAASRRDGDVIGFDTYAVRVRPLSSSVQALLRPSPGRPRTG
jgi:hypothetical protein